MFQAYQVCWLKCLMVLLTHFCLSKMANITLKFTFPHLQPTACISVFWLADIYFSYACNSPIGFCLQECAMLSKELTEMQERLAERDDEICELKAERNNTRVSYTAWRACIRMQNKQKLCWPCSLNCACRCMGLSGKFWCWNWCMFGRLFSVT